MKIAVAGAGYVGLANALALAQNDSVILVDSNEEVVELINRRLSPIADEEISEWLKNPEIVVRATANGAEAYENADVVFIAVPTDSVGDGLGLDTSIVRAVIQMVTACNPKALVVIKSTIPVGFTKEISEELDSRNIFSSPEFLREGKALYDCLHPTRIIVGVPEESEETMEKGSLVASLILEGIKSENVPVMIMGSSEAEAVKLFSNTYLAMRIGFFNELDTYAEMKGFDTERIISGMGHDPRIGLHYNNPSFGYGGYCLPKDSKELKKEFADVPNQIIDAIVESNETRKRYIASRVLEHKPKVVGIYRLVMKKGSDDFRGASIMDVMSEVSRHGVDVIVFEPLLNGAEHKDLKLAKDFREFAERSDVILANRMEDELEPYIKKVYSRDLFGNN